ncbi:MAG: hypothetical protein HYS12_13545 [Planctomycetes bacterium]|nr:hypothetical protein [Planctomycetota bacterium]
MIETTSEAAANATPPRRALLAWGAFAALLLLQWALFRHYVEREIATFVPRGFDQAGYLDESYRTYEVMLSEGFFRGVRYGLRRPIANGLLLHVQAAVLFLLFGPTRLTALSLNFLYFAAFQTTLFAVLHRLTRRWGVAFFGLGMLLAALTPHSPAGGLLDFRIDCIAFSLFGILLCVVARSGFFSSPRWSLAAGAVASLLVLFRLLTSVYLAGILGTWWLLTAARCVLSRDPGQRARLKQQLLGGVLAGTVLTAVAGPVLVWKRQLLWDYYVVNTIIGEDKDLRAKEFGVVSRADFYLFYARSVRNAHAGTLFLALAAAGVLAGIGLRLLPRGGLPGSREASWDRTSAWSLLACAGLVPYAALTLNVSKSPVLGGIFVAPLLWLGVLPAVQAARRRCPARGTDAVLTALACIAVAAGVHVKLAAVCRHETWPSDRDDAEQVLALHEEVIRQSSQIHSRPPMFSFDSVLDLLTHKTLMVYAYEQHGKLLDFGAGLGGSHLHMDEKTIWDLLEHSDLVVLTKEGRLASPVYPFNQQMRPMHGAVRRYCEEELVRVGRYPVADDQLTLYVRPSFRLEGESHGWITRRGLTLTAPAEFLRKRNVAHLGGKLNLSFLKRVPGVTVVMKAAGKEQAIPAHLDVTDFHYDLVFQVPAEWLPKHGQVTVDIKFDTWFVPHDLGLNDDTRELVVCSPDTVSLTTPSPVPPPARGQVGSDR